MVILESKNIESVTVSVFSPSDLEHLIVPESKEVLKLNSQ